jgi:chondroitin AC lyase
VFYTPGEIRISDVLSVMTDQPCVIMLKENEIGQAVSLSVSDPTRKLNEVIIQFSCQVASNESYEVEWDDIEGYSELFIELPQGDYAGQSRTVTIDTVK